MVNAYAFRSFRYELLTPQGRLETGQTVSVVLPAVDGLIGILARRAPLVAQVGAGRMTVRRTDGGVSDYYVAGGFAHIREGALTVLAEECTPAESLSQDAAILQLERARALPADTEADWQRRECALAAANAKLRLAQQQALARSVQEYAQ